MHIKYFCPIWGSDNIDFGSFLEKVRKEGYDGVEMSLPEDAMKKRKILDQLKNSDLQLIAQHWETLASDYKLHKTEYRRRLINLTGSEALFINSQTGKDYFSQEQNEGLIRIAEEIGKDYGIRIIHETHRGKFSFAPHITAGYLKDLPELRLGLDISHWCNVAESWLDDQPEALELALSRTDHIHARVGFPEGPQIPNPRAPEWSEALERHRDWWCEVINKRTNEGRKEFTITPEFGPYPYMTHMPFSREPVADQWDLNVFMMKYLRSQLS